jgi:hypothetical protein
MGCGLGGAATAGASIVLTPPRKAQGTSRECGVVWAPATVGQQTPAELTNSFNPETVLKWV